tara:strand:- start:9105 stop:9299 length:195 start_codon:yes stop_codon:yes gene_type:complete
MTKKQITAAKRVIRSAYGLSREPSTDEVEAEIANIKRRQTQGLGLDEMYSYVKSRLEVMADIKF